MIDPKVTIAIPVFNSEKYLEETLISLVHQSYSNLEILVVDNRSTDNTEEIVSKYCAKYDFVTFIKNETNIGAVNNFNKCLTLGKGDYLALFHGDDIYHPEIIAEAVKIFTKNDVSLVGALGHHIDENGVNLNLEFTMPRDLQRKTLKFNEVFEAVTKTGNGFLICPTMIFRRSDMDELGNFEFDKFQSAADLALWLKYSLKSKIYINQEKRIQYRLHKSQGSQKEIRDNIYLPDCVRVIKYYAKLYQGTSCAYNGYIAFHLMLTVWRRNQNRLFSFNKTLLSYSLGYLLKSRHLGSNEIKAIIMLPLLFVESFLKFNFFSGLVFELKKRVK